MRYLGLMIAAACWLLGGCTSPNPAWLSGTTDEAPGTGSTDPGASTTAVPATTSTAGTTDPPTTGGTEPATTGTIDPATTGGTEPPTTGGTDPDTTTGPGTTGGGDDGCVFPDALELELAMISTKPQVCDAAVARQVYAEVIGQVAPGRWKFNLCASDELCKDPQAKCAEWEHITFIFEGEPSLVPDLQVGECHHLDFLARTAVPDDPFACRLRALRIGHTRFTPELTQYVGAIDAPSTGYLPGPLDWAGLFGFTVEGANIDAMCQDAMPVCMPAAGTYSYTVTWEDSGSEHTVHEGKSFEEQVLATTDNQDQLELTGIFTAVRSHIEPGPCVEGSRDFRWAWLVKIPPP